MMTSDNHRMMVDMSETVVHCNNLHVLIFASGPFTGPRLWGGVGLGWGWGGVLTYLAVALSRTCYATTLYFALSSSRTCYVTCSDVSVASSRSCYVCGYCLGWGWGGVGWGINVPCSCFVTHLLRHYSLLCTFFVTHLLRHL